MLSDSEKLRLISLITSNHYEEAANLLHKATEPDPKKLPALSEEEWAIVRGGGSFVEAIHTYFARTGKSIQESKCAVEAAREIAKVLGVKP